MADSECEAKLRERGYKVTPQRRAVYAVLAGSQGAPLNTEDIHRRCLETQAGMGVATVYRALELFCEIGLAQHVHLHESASYYELVEPEHHHHLVCVQCGSMTAVQSCLVEDMADTIRDDFDFLVTSHCLSMFGYCPSCKPRGARRGKGKAA